MTNESKNRIGRYELERELGRGGMAIVYLAHDPELNRVVALKLIRKGAFPDEQMAPIIERFHREARALAKLNHPNIVKVLDYGDHEGSPYLVMDYLEGATLKEVKKPLRIATAVRLIRPIAEALDYVHRQGLLHRDVKPSNIMITKDDRVILTDFGIAKWIEDDGNQATLTGTGVGIGTPEYMAPEQGRGKGVDARSDLYSLSIAFYELITGVKPFHGDTPVDILIKQATEPVPDPREFVPELPDAVVRFFDIALAKRPDDRYPTMTDFIRDLDGLRMTSSGTQNASSGRTRIQTNPAPLNPTGSSVRFGGTDLRKVREATIVDPLLKRIPTPYSAPSESAKTPAKPGTLPRRRVFAAAGAALLTVLAGVVIFFNRSEPEPFDPTPPIIESPSIQAQTAITRSTTPEPSPADDSGFELTQAAAAAIEEKDDIVKTNVIKETDAIQAANAIEATDAFEKTNVAVLMIELENYEKTAQAKVMAETETAIAAYQGTISALERTQEALNQSMTEAVTARTLSAVAGQSATKKASAQRTAATATEAAKNPYADLRAGSQVRLGRYEQDNDLSNGAEAIEWRVLAVSNGMALLISRSGLNRGVYHDKFVDTDWEHCSLRAWLNETFYEEVFSAEEKKYIIETKIDNSGNSASSVDGGASTKDKIFLLSRNEAERYFSGSFDRIVRPTGYALANGAWVSKESGYEGNGWWWLRSLGADAKQASRIFVGGAIDPEGGYVNDDRGLIRPAFWLKIE